MSSLLRVPQPSIRLRLTAVYSALFVGMGTVLLVLSFAVVRHEFRYESGRVHVAFEEVVPRRSATRPSRTLKVRIAPGLPLDSAAPVRTLDADARQAYSQARTAYSAQIRAANNRALRNVLVWFAGALFLLTLASIAAGWMLAGRALRPISRITATARSISERTLDARIALEGPRDELRELADTFDSMLGRLEGAFESQRRFVANASHELRTPLAIVRTELDVTLEDPEASVDDLRGMAAVVGDANTRMERLIASLLALASSEAGVAQARAADLARAVRPALDRERAFYVGGTLRLDAQLDDAPVLGDPVLLERMAANLVENAVRYNGPAGSVWVWSGVEHHEAVLRVANTGPLIEPAELEGVLEPFRRLESSRARATGGYGLGLAVVRAVAEAHGGRVRLHARAEGGLEVMVALPLERDRRRVPALVG